jgi:NitT/TauT family transport system permease protein
VRVEPARARSLPVDLALVGGLLLLLLLALFGSASLRPYDAPELDPRPALLPVYLIRSLARLLVAYTIAALLALATGNLAARSAFARRLILPTLDVLQSVPILGFFPVAVSFFIALSRGSALGVEAAAVFLIFTCMFWNLAFGVYESLITIPEDVRLAAAQLDLSGPLRWSRLVLPAVAPGLIYNSQLSWANGWYFLIASEIIAVGPARYTLPGLGSYLAQAVTVGRADLTLLALGVLVLTTVVVHLFVWSPLETWAERFHLEESGDRPRVPRMGRVLGRSRLVRMLARRLILPLGQQALIAGGRILHFIGRHAAWTGALAAAALAPLLLLAGLRLYRLFSERPASPVLAELPLDLALSAARVAAGVLLSAAIAIPLARWVARFQSIRNTATVAIQVLASVPATAFFPLIAALVGQGLNVNLGAALLALTTMFWYVLFNVLGGALSIPKDLHEVAASLGLRGGDYLRRVFVPAVAPSLVTGCVTAWGAGWNAMILCEYFEAGGRVLSVRGIGAALARATYVSGDMQVVAASLASMVLLIVLVNRLFWDPLYLRVAARYRMDV